MLGNTQRKKVILTIIDSFNPHALQSCLQHKLVPALAFFKDSGYFTQDCVSTFPTMTPTAASSIATGTTPSAHQVPGFIWFDRREKRFINYGASFWAVIKSGVYQVLLDLMYNLNHKQLSGQVKTIYELLESSGFTTGAVNPYIFRGSTAYQAKIPMLLKILTRFRLGGPIWGPQKLILGQMYQPSGTLARLANRFRHWKRWGMNDEFSGTAATWFIQNGQQPDFMSIYLPDTDNYSHTHRPAESGPSLKRADRQLQKILNAYATWEKALQENVFIIAGDHSQSLIASNSNSTVDLRSLLADFSQARLGEQPVRDKDIAICPNERMAHIYLLSNRWGHLRRVLALLRQDNRIDQVAWRDHDWYRVAHGSGDLAFRREGPVVDEYGHHWTVQGDLAVVDACTEAGCLVYHDYPDALDRIAGALEAEQAGDVMVTAKLGCEFDGEGAPTHRGMGSHGSLHREDSFVPLFITGTEANLQRPRILDLTPFIMRHFGLNVP